MSTIEKFIKKIISNKCISFSEAEKALVLLGFEKRITGSHHVFRKKGYATNVSLKKRRQLLAYQIKMVKVVLLDHGHGQFKL